MKKLLAIIAALVVIVVAGLTAATVLIPMDRYKQEIVTRVKAQTGRDLVIAGPIRLSFFPNIGAHLEDVTFSNPEGFSAKEMAQFKAMTVEVALLPLLHGGVEIKRFILEQPVIHLEINQSGVANWVFASPAAAAPAPAPAEHGGPGLGALSGLTLGEIKITEGTLTYDDLPKKIKQTIADAHLALNATQLDAPLTIVGNLAWNGEKVSLDVKADTLAAFLNGREAKINLKLDSKPLSLSYDGKGSMQSMKGDATLSIPSIPRLAAWTENPINWEGKGALQFTAKGTLAYTPTSVAFTQATLGLDDVKANGDLSVGLGEAVPTVKAQLDVDALDVNPFLPSEKKQTSIMPFLIADAEAATWSEAPIDFSALKKFNADIGINAGSIRYQNLKFGKTALVAKIASGQLTLDLKQIELYSGAGKATITASDANKIGVQCSLSSVQLAPLLKDATGSDSLSGTASLEINVNGSGASQQQIISSLAGNGQAHITNGALTGVNLAQLARNVQSVVTGAANPAEKTEFSDLGGTFTIAQGIVKNNDLAMKGSLLHLTGQGTINLPQQMVHYRLVPELTASKDSKAGIAVPILVDGPLDHPSYRPDMAGIAQGVLNSPQAAKQTIQDLGKQLKPALKKPAQIQNLLNGLGR